MSQGNFDAAIEVAKKGISLNPDSPFSCQALARAYLGKGSNAEALAAAQRSVELSKPLDTLLVTLGKVYIKTGKRTEANAIAKELEEKYPKNEATALSVVWLYVLLGDNEKALVWLEKAFAAKDFDIPAFTRDEETKSLREDPRYKAMLKRLGLPE